MKFRKRVKVFPGFHLNFSASGMSSTIGPKGMSINIQHNKPAEKNNADTSGHSKNNAAGRSGEIKSAALDQLSSSNLNDLKEILTDVYKDKIELSGEIGHTRTSLSMSEIIHVVSRFLLIGFFIKSFREIRDEKRAYLADLEQQRENAHVNIDLHFDTTFQEKYHSVVEGYKTMLTSRVIWDITSSVEQDRVASRSAASHVVNRLPVTFKLDNIDIIRSSCQALHFENKNGGDLYIYPGFVVMTSNMKDFALIDLKDFEVRLSQQRFIEEEKVPDDTAIVGNTWAKVNKNGTPDKRFKDNYEIPIVRYGQIDVRSDSGLNEVYAVSNYEAAERFVTALNDYQRLLRN